MDPKFAVTYNKSFRYLDEIDEIIYPFINDPELMINITSSIKPEKRIIIDLSNWPENRLKNDSNIIIIIKTIKEKHSNMAVRMNMYWNKELLNSFKEKFPIFFVNFANTYEAFYHMAEMGVSDIYVTEGLAFELQNLQKIRKEQDIKIRVFPDVAQSQFKDVPDTAKFWIRPEDIDLYSEYVDVFEIFHDYTRSSVVYEIYKQQQWVGGLYNLIEGITDNIDNTTITPHFGKSRLNCQQRCLIGKCNICPNIMDLAAGFGAVGVEIVKDKHEVPIAEKLERFKNIMKGSEENREFESNQDTV